MNQKSNAIVWTKTVIFHYGPFVAFLSFPMTAGAESTFNVVAIEKLKPLPTKSSSFNATVTHPSGEGSWKHGTKANE